MPGLKEIPFTPLGAFPTPLQPVSGYHDLSIKRDDLSGFDWAGNKARPLEYLIADAMNRDSQCVVSGGMSTSNFIAALAGAACHAGLHCHLLVPEPVVSTTSVRLARLSGATIEGVGESRDDLDGLIEARARQLSDEGHDAYPIPRGGATAVGALGFARAVAEAQEQRPDSPATIVIPVGSGASAAGLLAGIALTGAAFDVVGVSVSRPPELIRPSIMDLARQVQVLLGGDTADDTEKVDSVPFTLVDRREATPTHIARETLRSLACRGILVDGHYGIPAWIVAEELARADRPVIYWHTGGMAGVSELLSEVQE